MSSYKEYINEFIASTNSEAQQSAVENLANLLQNNQLSLLNFIQSLQFYITSTNDNIRISTFNLLSQILHKISATKLFPKDIDVLLTFLSSKLLDKPITKYVFSCIFSLISMKFFNKERTNELIGKLLENYNPKEHPQSIRLLALKIVNYLITSFSQSVYSNDQIIDCFLHISQNEKDPNNLILIFQILQTISKNLDINNYVQPLFDTMFRYYPISFKSSNEAQETQIASLKDSLNASLASNDLYAEELFPNLIEKYNAATLAQVKLDILTTISSVSNVYSKSIIQENFLSIWNTLKYSIINQELAQLVSIPSILSYYENSSNESDQIFHSALIAIKHLSKHLDYDLKLLIFDDLFKNLIITDRNRRFLQSYLTLAIVLLPIGDPEIDNEKDEILDKTLKELFSIDQPLDQIKNKRLILVALSYFISDSKFISHLIPFRDNILTLLQSSLSSSELETTLRALAIQLTVYLILSPTLIDNSTNIEYGLFDEESAILIGKLAEILIENGLKNSIDLNLVIEKELLMSLVKLSKNPKCENNIVGQVINNILLKLNELELSLSQKCILLNYLIKIAQTQSLIQIASIRLINLLPNDGFELTESNIPVELILQSLSSLFITLPLSYNTQTISKKFIPILIHFIFKQGEDVSEYQISYICEIIRRLVVGLKNESANILFLECFNIYSLILNLAKFEISIEDKHLSLFNDVNIDNKLISISHIPILLSLIQGLDISIGIKSRINLIEILKSLVSILDKSSPLTNLQILIGFAVIFNKYLDWNDYLTIFENSITTSALALNVWSLYGLIMKCDTNATETFVNLLSTLEFSKASTAISIIFTPIDEISNSIIIENEGIDQVNINNGLNTDVKLLCAYKKDISSGMLMVRNKNKLVVSNLILRNMWKQRILEILLTKNSEKSSNMDSILPLILTYLPEELYQSHLTELLPSLIKTLQITNDNKIVISILKIICNVVIQESGRELIKPYIDTIMELCLHHSRESKNAKELKKQALKCLLGMSLFNITLVVPFKKQVIKVAEFVLSDKSRSVRMLAVTVRQSWENLGIDLSL
jgi:DNA repair/transcription protein MET18/MMS19